MDNTTWQKLAPEEKLLRRFAAWKSPEGVEYASPEAQGAYKARVTRIIDAIQLEKTPDRVPIIPSIGFFPAYYSRLTPHDVMYDAGKAVEAWTRFTLDFQPDVKFTPLSVMSGRLFDLLDYKLYNWPGHGVDPDRSFQYVESEYMKPEEYDALIQDPTDFWLRTYLPRTMGALGPWTLLSPLTDMMEIVFTPGGISKFGLPQVVDSLERLVAAGREGLNWAGKLIPADRKLESLGFPRYAGGFSKAPFDVIGDTLRGTRGTMLDMFRRRDKLVEAADRIAPLMVRTVTSRVTPTSPPIVVMPLHKGAEGFMSDEQFKTLYWPSLRKVVLGLIDEGIVPVLFAEGGFGARLEVVRDLPKGKVIWHLDRTDMGRAKEVLGDVACIMGNVPGSLLSTGTPDDVMAYCRELIATAGKGGGFILSTGTVVDEARAENVRAMMESARKYGVYV